MSRLHFLDGLRGIALILMVVNHTSRELRTGTLHVLKIPGRRFTMPVVLVHRRRAYLSGATRRLMTVLKEE